jgi:alpha,alpha-trehalase
MRLVQGEVLQGGSPFPPIATLAFLSDCEVAALLGPDGSVEWMCLPRFDGPSVFGALLDRDAGSFRLGPTDTHVAAGRRYLPGTMVLETTWNTPTGWIVVHEALLIGPWHHDDERSPTHRRTPTDTEADHVLLRTVRCLNGRVDLVMECRPRMGYGARAVHWRHEGAGYGSAVATGASDDPVLRLTTDLRLGFEGAGRARARTTLREGDTAYVALSWSEHPAPRDAHEATERLDFTARYWREWLAHGQFPDHPWRSYLQRSALTLKGLAYAPSGAMVAAPTTSLPETPGGLRNWDYRYTWVRDSTFALWALYTLGIDDEADDFFHFIRDVAAEGPLQVLYGIGGERDLPERTLEHLSGYENAAPVRVGNAAFNQRQHDVWGTLMDSIYLHTRARDALDDTTWRLLRDVVEEAIAHWQEPDRGIWEVRGQPRHFTVSKVMCWVACDRGARLAALRDDGERAERWSTAAEEIHADVCANAVHDGVFRQHYDTDALDASCLLLPLVRFLPPEDARIVDTVHAILDGLAVDGLVRRYLVKETDDGLVGPEGAFTTCSFWMVSALAEIGEPDAARALCEKVLCYASPLRLYAEEIEPGSGRQLGNFPQAFTHLALINALMHVIRADDELVRGEPLMKTRRREVVKK